MIIDGKRAVGVVPVCEKGDAIAFSVALSGTTIKTVHTFTDYGYLHEIGIKVPTLAGAVSVVLTLHDKNYQTAADARYTSPALEETAVHIIRAETLLATVLPFKRFVRPGDTLRVAANAGAGTETLEGVMQVAGI
jgi:hypothetical protein